MQVHQTNAQSPERKSAVGSVQWINGARPFKIGASPFKSGASAFKKWNKSIASLPILGYIHLFN